MGMGGSILPSHDSATLAPVVLRGVTFKVEPLPALETYALMAGGSLLASHPNGHSLRELVRRIAACHEGRRDAAYAEAQFEYILKCGGTARSIDALRYYLGLKP